MAAVTERIVVQVTPGQKRTIAGVAKRNGMNVSELMRTAAETYTPSGDEHEMTQLIARVNASTEEANAALDEALAYCATSNQRIAAMTTEGKH